MITGNPAQLRVGNLALAAGLLIIVAIAGAAPGVAATDEQASPLLVDAGWTTSRSIPAAEAFQAAAADGEYLYAISNTQVAKYDRRTGKRIAVSRGDAKHLNSGFLLHGKLYCAHSNYPKTPERSEIKVLDVETMQLSTFKDFGAYGGSLTWAIKRGDHWWCNFAHYGKANHKTFLASFDDQWRETGRWTYPPDLLRQLGNYSLSGGIWDGEHLLVTGHDDGVVFRLRLPKKGGELELVGQAPVPFTGQGIAHDPVDGGLVGIDRGKREIVIAARNPHKALQLRVLSYNIHHGEGIDRQLDLPRIARTILSVKPDLVALQEVDRLTQRTGKVDQPAELAKLTGMEVAFGRNIDFQGGQYGNALLSRLPIRTHKNELLPRLDEGEQRGVLTATIDLPGERPPLRFLATHLDHRRSDAERLASAAKINELAKANAEQPAILAGDLNDIPKSRTLKELLKQWTQTSPAPMPTVPVKAPTRQIDYVLIRPASRWKVVETKVLDEAVASDHRAILCVLQLVDESD